MTSPLIDKPENTTDQYADVHSRGTSFGQDLRGTNLREMLMGRAKGPFDGAIDAFTNFMEDAGTALTNVWNQLSGGGSIVELPPLWKEYEGKAFQALEPIYSMADKALDRAGTAQGKAEDLSEDLTRFVEVDYAEAKDAYDQSLVKLTNSVDDVNALIPEVTGAAEAVSQAQAAVDAAMADLNKEISRTKTLADQVDASSLEYQNQVAAANAAAERVEAATATYSDKVAAAEQLLSDMETAQTNTANAASKVEGLVGTPEWDEAVTGFIYWQDQLNEDQSEFNTGVTSALAALEMVTNKQSDFNLGVQDALWVQDQVNQDQSDFNQGVNSALDALAMVQEEQSDFNQGVDTAISALKTFANLQAEVNEDVEQALKDQAGVNDVNEINWQTTTQYMEQNDNINRTHTEALKLHENQLVMMDDSRPRAWAFYTSRVHERDPWVSVRVNTRALGFTSYIEIQALGSWAGRIMVSISFFDQGTGSDSAVDQYDWLVTRGDAEHRHIRFNAGATHMGIKNVAVTVYPYYGNRKREFLLQPHELGSSPGFALQRTEAYTNDLEGNPLTWNYQDSVRFMDLQVQADQPTYLYGADKEYHPHPANSPIEKGTYIRAEQDRLIKFTEV